MTEHNFDIIKFGIAQHIGDELMYPHVDIRRIIDGWGIYMSGKVLGQNSLQHYEVRYPADWWQAFKERWFRGWLRNRYPVKYETVAIDVDAVYPELHKKLHLPDEKHFYQIRTWTDSE